MAERFTTSDLPRLGARLADTHKGTYGTLLTVTGSRGMTGAACLTAQAAVSAGSGIVRCVLPASLEPILETKLTEALTAGVTDTGEGAFAEGALRAIVKESAGADAMVLGPGIGRSLALQRLVAGIAGEVPIPLVLDADGLNNLGANTEVLAERTASTIVTPHPGEMAHLVATTSAAVQEDRQAIAEAFAAEHGVVVALKGHRTVVTNGASTYVNLTGNPGMAGGGTGDVLSGIVGAFLAVKIDPFPAAALGVFVHGLAGDLAAKELGETALRAEDLLAHLPQALRFVEE